MQLQPLSRMDTDTQFIPDVKITSVQLSKLELNCGQKTLIPSKGEISCYVLLQGKAWFELDSGDVWECEPGTIVAMSKPIRHSWATTQEKGPVVIHPDSARSDVDELSAEQIKSVNEKPTRLFAITVPETANIVPDIIQNVFVVRPQDRQHYPGLWTTVELVMRPDFRKVDSSNVLLKRYVEAIATILILYGVRVSGVGQAGGEKGLYDQRVRKVLSALHEDITHDWTTEKLCDIANMSKTGLVERFKTLIGMSPQHYLLQIRMQHAASLLYSSTMCISEIAELAGYQSESSFSKAFQKKVGYTPGRYRDLIRRGDINDFS